MKNTLTRTCSIFPLTLLGLTWALFPPVTGLSQKHQRLPDSELLEVGRGRVAPIAHAPAEIKIVSYNIRWRSGEELRELIKLLKDDPDVGGASVIGLQEVDRNKKRTNNINTVKLIAEELGKHYVWAAPPGTKADKEEETGVAILSSYPLSDVHRVVLPHEGPGGRRRVAIGATLVVAGAPLRVYSVHSETRLSVENKIGQMKAVLQDLEQFPRDISAVILGDFNTWEPDAVEKTSELFTTEKFSTPFKNDQETFWRRVLSIPITLKLDWIWLRGLETTSSGVDEKICLSDHWPLWVVVRVKSNTINNALVK